MEDLEEVSKIVFEHLFLNKKNLTIHDGDYEIERLGSRRLRSVKIEGLLFLEQNPHKRDSEWAKKARQGQKIMWVLKGRRYVAQVVDGKFTLLK